MSAQDNPTVEFPQELKTRPLQFLLAYDSSQHARAAVELLRDLHIREEIHTTVLSVMPTQYFAAHESFQAAMDEASAQLQEKGMHVTSILKVGNPAATINAHAQEIATQEGHMDLIIMGAKGRRATLGILLGGVAQQVVEYSCCPVLIVRAPYGGLKRVLLVTDGSISSRQALEYLVPHLGTTRPRQFPLPPKAKIHLMHVLPPPLPVELTMRAWTVGPEVLYPAPPIDQEAIEAEEQRVGQHIITEALAVLAAGGIRATSVLNRGDAATEIIDYAKKESIDLIVCGSRGLSAVTGWLLGSVSRKLVHYAGCSVLIVKSGESH
jgi:nucleotide-binding universal stress UspA family protein